MLRMLRDHLGARVDLLLHPTATLSDVPLKSYYARALPQVLQSGAPLDVLRSRATLSALPTSHVLTMNLAVPESWVVEVRFNK
jgi:hypothetical protein